MHPVTMDHPVYEYLIMNKLDSGTTVGYEDYGKRIIDIEITGIYKRYHGDNKIKCFTSEGIIEIYHHYHSDFGGECWIIQFDKDRFYKVIGIKEIHS